jgi:hypothetical protein
MTNPIRRSYRLRACGRMANDLGWVDSRRAGGDMWLYKNALEQYCGFSDGTH